MDMYILVMRKRLNNVYSKLEIYDESMHFQCHNQPL